MFRHSEDENDRLKKEELTVSEWERIAKEMFDAGVLNILMTGGEPLLRKDFTEIYKSIYQHGFLITVYTNAIPVNEEILETFRRYPPHRIGITLYGASNKTYEKLCFDKNGFDKAIKGARALSTLPSAIEFRTTVVQDNKDEINELTRLIKQEFDLPITHSTTVFQNVRGGCMPIAECRLSPKETVDLVIDRSLEAIREALPPEKRKNVSVRLAETKPNCKSETKQYTLLGCSGGMDSFTITYDGKLLGCQMLDNFYTDVRSSGFAEAWEKWPYTVRLPEVDPECKACPHQSLCQVCPGVRMAECGSLSGRPDYICKITNLFLKHNYGDEKIETPIQESGNRLGTDPEQ
jgi:radical SAM protein with 4Fe4S-binding SPASM domain